jgi:hypothetical protein
MLKMLLDYRVLVPLALFFGLAPFVPQPHLVEKFGMLVDGTLHRPLDIFDLFWHSWPLALLAFRVFQDTRTRLGSSQ